MKTICIYYLCRALYKTARRNPGYFEYQGVCGMAQFVPLKSSVVLRLNTGAHPETGKPVLKTVSIRGVDPALAADNLKTVGDLLSPLFVHPVIAVEKSGTHLLESA